MDRGTKIAIVLAACFSILAGVLWDQVVNAPIAPANTDASTGESMRPAPNVLVHNYQVVTHGLDGTVRIAPPDPEPRTDVPAPTAIRPARPSAGRGDGNSRRTAPEPERTPDRSYTAKRNDSLWTIAKKFYGSGTLCGALQRYNGLPTDAIDRGQVLKIPDIEVLRAQ